MRSGARCHRTSGCLAMRSGAMPCSSHVRTTWRRRGAWWTRSLHAVTPDHAYEPQTWGPAEADRIIAHEGGWRNPTPVEAAS